MKLSFINVGYGDAILIEQAGCRVLIDAGSGLPGEYGPPSRIRAAEYLQRIGVTHLDRVFITHTHEDHIGGLKEVMDTVTVGEICVPLPPELLMQRMQLTVPQDAPESVRLFAKAYSDCTELLGQAKGRGIPIREIGMEDSRVSLCPGIQATVLGPEKRVKEAFCEAITRAMHAKTRADGAEVLALLDRMANSVSLVLLLAFEGTRILLPADAVSENWKHIPFSLLQNVNVLKLPHHAQNDSISSDYAALLAPGYVITTASSDRRYGSANPAVYERIREHEKPGKAPVFLFTDETDYAPYFHAASAHNAVQLLIESGTIVPELIQIT